MKLIEATREFQIRYYNWATSEFETEINEAFPKLRTFKNGAISEAYQLMQQLNQREQSILSRGLLKRAHADAVKMLGDGLSDEEKSWLERFDNRPPIFGLAGNGVSGQKVKYASRSQLRKVVETAFTNAYGSQCVKIQVDERWDPWFEMKFAGWIVATRFTFGRRQSLICYYHSIESQAKLPLAEFPPEYWPPAMRLGHWLSLASRLGVANQTQWVSLEKGEVDQACVALIKCCGRFFEAVPQLLKGLEFERITEGDNVRGQP